MNIRSMALVVVAASLASSCAKDPVDWSDVRYSMSDRAGAAESSPAESGVALVSDAPTSIPDSALCKGSVRVARAARTFFAAWWSLRRDSSVILRFSTSDDGGAWTKPVVADSSDAGSRGCDRPAPSIAADIASGYVHVAYFVEPSQGGGVFYVHSMDRGETFHAPVPIVFGARPSKAAVTAEGDRVAVAYEDPNSARPRIFVALSRSMGHLFELKLPVSDDAAAALDPAAHLRGTKLEVSWTEMNPADSTRTRHASRTGNWK